VALKVDDELISNKIFNVGYENYTVKKIAEMVKGIVGDQVAIKYSKTDDLRSYHISSKKIEKELGFKPRHSVEEAIKDLVDAFKSGKIPDPLNNMRYYNIKTMLARKLE
jgi:nucleoside-diphosphate-sugar epimerase